MPTRCIRYIRPILYEGGFRVKIHIVKEGDTLFNLSQKYGVDLEDIIKANPQLKDPDQIDVGMKIKIPSKPQTVPAKKLVKKKETLEKKEPKVSEPFQQEKLPEFEVGSFYDLPKIPDLDVEKEEPVKTGHAVAPEHQQLAPKAAPTLSDLDMMYVPNAFLYTSSTHEKHSHHQPSHPIANMPIANMPIANVPNMPIANDMYAPYHYPSDPYGYFASNSAHPPMATQSHYITPANYPNMPYSHPQYHWPAVHPYDHSPCSCGGQMYPMNAPSFHARIEDQQEAFKEDVVETSEDDTLEQDEATAFKTSSIAPRKKKSNQPKRAKKTSTTPKERQRNNPWLNQ